MHFYNHLALCLTLWDQQEALHEHRHLQIWSFSFLLKFIFNMENAPRNFWFYNSFYFKHFDD